MAKGGKGGKARGKQPKGRAKARAKAQQSPRSLGLGPEIYTSSDSFDGRTPYISFRGFNQKSPGADSPRNPNVKLRHQAIAFVSAGTNTPVERRTGEHVAVEVSAALDDNRNEEEEEEEEEEEKEEEEKKEEEEEKEEEKEEDEDEGLDTIQTNIVMDIDADIANGTANLDINIHNDLFVVDIEGDPTLAETGSQKKLVSARTPSPARSESSSEEVLFCGRGRPSQSQSRSPRFPPQSSHLSASNGAKTILVEARARPEYPDGHAKGWAARPSSFDKEAQQASSTWQAAPSHPYWKKPKSKPDLDSSSKQMAIFDQKSPRAAKAAFSSPPRGAEDTIASLQEEVRSFQRKKQKAKAAKKAALHGESESTDDVIDGPLKGRRRKRGRKKDNRHLRRTHISEDDGEAAYDDYMQNLAAQSDTPIFTPVNVLPETGSFIVADGQSVKDDEVLNSNLDMDDNDTSSDDCPIGQHWSDVSGDGIMDLSDLSSSELEDELEYAEQEQWEDEADLRKRRQDRMTDEHIARLFAKQRDMGIDCDDLVIDDGIFDDDDDDDSEQEGIGDLLGAHMGFCELTNASIRRPRNKYGMRTSRRGNGRSFPNASALADAVDQYGGDGFDIMDFDRPSLRSTRKGRKGSVLPSALDAMSDEELKTKMVETWENDRKKKRLKKAEREKFRAQGLLGAASKKGKSDLSQKYLQGLTMTQVHEEIRIFLNDESQSSRPFPPMDKRDRKALHNIAHMLNLKSKSVGSGPKRFPVLYKTARTAAYEESYFNRVVSMSSRSFLKNAQYSGGNGKQGKLPKHAKVWGTRGGGYDRAAVSLRNGEVVGANAAEIGRDNIGHKLMEKMGWTKGMALGKDGEGLLVPVEQVMRSGKAGLG